MDLNAEAFFPLQAEPSNKNVRALRLRYKNESAAANAKEGAMYKRAFQKLAQMPDTNPKPAPQSHPIKEGRSPIS